ncbi:MAG: hypothetical protein IKR57_01715 [Bacilli bacterium]|nr:hypothetical protein [Bacilli bacterium]
MNIYALYHGDNFIDMGTKEYLSKLLGVSEKTILFYSSPTYLKRTDGNGWVVIKVEELNE